MKNQCLVVSIFCSQTAEADLQGGLNLFRKIFWIQTNQGFDMANRKVEEYESLKKEVEHLRKEYGEYFEDDQL